MERRNGARIRSDEERGKNVITVGRSVLWDTVLLKLVYFYRRHDFIPLIFETISVSMKTKTVTR